MEPIKELEECVDMVFNATKTLTEAAEDIAPNTSDASFDAIQDVDAKPTSEPEEDDHMSDLSDVGSEFEEGDQVVVVDPEDEQLNGTKWIYDGPSDRSPDMAEVHSEIGDKDMAIEYSKIQKVSLETDNISTEPKTEPAATTNDSALDSLKINDPEKNLGESKSIEDVVMSVLEFAPAVAAAAGTTGTAAAGEGVAAAAGAEAIKGAAMTAGQQAANSVINKGKEIAKEITTGSTDSDDKPVIECDETNKTCPKCQSSPCKCEKDSKKRTFVTKKIKESFEEMKTRKLAEAKEKGFSISE